MYQGQDQRHKQEHQRKAAAGADAKKHADDALKRSRSQRGGHVETAQARIASDRDALAKEIAALRGQGEAEAKVETQRMAQQTEAEIAKIQAHAEQEIASAGKTARMALKRYSAELAMGLAEQKVRARMTPETEDALVQGF